MGKLPKLIYQRYSEINKIRWDEALKSFPNALAYATTWYLDAVTNDHWDAIVTADYEWLMPIPLKSKFGVKYLPTPLFTQQLGVFGAQKVDSELSNHFFKHIASNIPFIEFQLNASNAAPELEGFTNKLRTNLILHLNPDRNLIKNGFSDNIKRNIRKAQEAKLRYNTTSARAIIKLFQEDKAVELKKFKVEWYNLLDQLYNVAALRTYGKCYGAYDPSGNLLAGMFIIEWQSRATFIFSGNSVSGKECGAMPALINHYLENAPESIKIFDFEGSDNEGLQRFYRSFGAVEANYVHLNFNRLPFYMRWLKA
jgi:hypothetical protein